jgi:hypothetical protein
MNPFLIPPLVIILIIFGIFILFVYKSKKYQVATMSFFISVTIPIVSVRSSCLSNSASEACVWGKSFLPAYVCLAIGIGTPLVYLIIISINHLLNKFNGGNSA